MSTSYQRRPGDRAYSAVLRGGHVGAGNHVEVYRTIYAPNLLEAMRVAERLGGIKKGRNKPIIELKLIEERCYNG